MKYSNELKVGATIIIATVIFVLGVRYFEDLPLFRGTYDLVTEFDNAAGLIPGNVVRVNGVTVGSVDEVFINPENNRVRVFFHVDASLPLTDGSRTFVSGLDAVGVVRMDIELGTPGGARIEEGSFLESKATADFMGNIVDRAPGIVDKMDAVLGGLDGLLIESQSLLSEPDSDLRQTLVSVRRSVTTLDNLLRTERDRIGSILTSVEGATAGVDSFFADNSDALSATVGQMGSTMARLDSTLASLDQTSSGLNDLLARINGGEGTLGLLVNDPSMYYLADSTLKALNGLLVDFQANPGKYLKEMRLVDLF